MHLANLLNKLSPIGQNAKEYWKTNSLLRPAKLLIIGSSSLAVEIYSHKVSPTFLSSESDQPFRLLRLMCKLPVHFSMS